MPQLVVDRDDSDQASGTKLLKNLYCVWVVLDRINGLKQQVHYYNYKDTATSSFSPFKPELIEILVHVLDNEPLNPLAVQARLLLALENLEPLKEYANVRFFKGDVRSFDLLSYILQSECIDTVMHFAAQSHVDNSFGTRLSSRRTTSRARTCYSRSACERRRPKFDDSCIYP